MLLKSLALSFGLVVTLFAARAPLHADPLTAPSEAPASVRYDAETMCRGEATTPQPADVLTVQPANIVCAPNQKICHCSWGDMCAPTGRCEFWCST